MNPAAEGTKQCFPIVLFIMLHKVAPTFNSIDDLILNCDHSNEHY